MRTTSRHRHLQCRAAAWTLLPTLALHCLVFASPCAARDIFVDNRLGSDVFDGRAEQIVNESTGPVKTLERAMEIAGPRDRVILRNNELPYYDSLHLSGQRHSGVPEFEFTIVGNGVVLDGSRPVPPYAWREAGRNLWRFTPWRKGHYLLLLDGRPTPEFHVSVGAAMLPEIPPGHWCAWRGSIYFRSSPGESPQAKSFRYAADGVGLGLFAVENVIIRDLTVRHFRVDGVNVHDLCRNVVLENVAANSNGRAGLFVGGSSSVTVRRCELIGNRRDDLLLSRLGLARLEETVLGNQPTLPD